MIGLIRKECALRDGIHSGLKALVADDDSASAAIMKYLLIRSGLEVTLVNDGLECYCEAVAFEYDIIFMDYYMPIISGIEATVKIRKAGLDQIPIIGMTGSITFSRERLKKSGFSDALFKPYNKEDVLAILSTHLKRNKKGVS